MMAGNAGMHHGATLLSKFVTLAALALILLFAWGCGQRGAEEPAAASPALQGKIIDVQVDTLVAGSFEEFARLTGTVKAEHDVLLSAEEPGRIVRLAAEKGDWVRRGQALVKIDDALLRTSVAEAEAESALAADQYERQREVWEEQRIGTEIAYLERRRRAAQTAAVLQQLRTRLDRTTIRAPFDGLLEDRFIDPGEMAAAGSPVVRVLDPLQLKVEVGVPERFAPDIRVGSRALITFDMFPGREFSGQVRFAGHAVDPENRTFPVEIGIENTDGVIKPEMVSNVRLLRRTLEDVLVVPQESLRNVEDGFVAFVAVSGESGPVVEERRVQIGPAYANRVVVESGLHPGDLLIVRGHRQVAQGSRVRIDQSPPNAISTEVVP